LDFPFEEGIKLSTALKKLFEDFLFNLLFK